MPVGGIEDAEEIAIEVYSVVFDDFEADSTPAAKLRFRPLFRALASASDYDLVEPLLARITTLSRMKIVAAIRMPAA